MQLTCVKCNKQIVPADPHAHPEGPSFCGEPCFLAYHADPNNRHEPKMFPEPTEVGHHQTQLALG